MPRKARIDSPGALQHIIFRGIERRKIFWTDEYRDDFVGRLGTVIEETSTACHAWELLPNHFHLLLKTGNTSLATAIRWLLTGYVVVLIVSIAALGICFKIGINPSCFNKILAFWNWYATST
jgi:putative transposase